MRRTPRSPHRGAVLAVILVGYLLILIDVSILMAALPRIHADLGFSAAGLSWAQNAYTLTFGGLLLLGARVGDLLGRRRTFMLGIGLFTAASLAVGAAQSPGVDDRRARRAGQSAPRCSRRPRWRCCRRASPKGLPVTGRWPPTARSRASGRPLA